MRRAVVLRPGDGRNLRVNGAVEALAKVDSAHSRDGFSLVELSVPPGEGPGQHLHEDFSETYYLLSGELVFLLGPERHTLTPGCLVHVPPGVVHGYRNEGEVSVRLLQIFAPGRFLTAIESAG